MSKERPKSCPEVINENGGMGSITGVCPMIGKDIEEVTRLERVCFSKYWSENLIRSGLDSRLGTYSVCQDHDRISGYSIIRVLADEGETQRTAVYPNYRRQRIARELMDAMVSFSRTRGVWAVALEVRESNEGARKLYGSYGLRQEIARKGHYHSPQEDAVIVWSREI